MRIEGERQSENVEDRRGAGGPRLGGRGLGIGGLLVALVASYFSGISDQVQRQRSRLSAERGNALLVRQELQADCLAGVWANRAERAKRFLEPGDVEEALTAAAAIGDDTLQRQSQGQVVPDSFTHGTSAQRVRWLRRGLESGDLKSCDTFNVAQP